MIYVPLSHLTSKIHKHGLYHAVPRVSLSTGWLWLKATTCVFGLSEKCSCNNLMTVHSEHKWVTMLSPAGGQRELLFLDRDSAVEGSMST